MTDPLCPHFGRCGGCTYQNIPYEAQVAEKRRILEEASGFSDITVFTDSPYGYRNRLDMVIHPGGLGFRQKGKWYEIVDVDHCPIASPGMNALIREIREFFAGADTFHIKKKIGTFRHAVIRVSTVDSAVSIVVNAESDRLQEGKERVYDFAKHTSANNVVIAFVSPDSGVSISETVEVVKGRDMMREEYLGHSFLYSIQGFFQTNSPLAEKMHEYTRSLLSKHATSDATLLDLYGGVGTFGIINADLFRQVFTVENFAGCVDAARENIAKNGISNGSAHLMDAKEAASLPLTRPLFAVVDPPRSGLHPKAIKAIRELAPEVIIFVSCNPKILKEELAAFEGYEIRSAALFDFFPQTPHAEAVLELVRITV